MDPSCKFALQYQPVASQERLDPILETHVRHCEDCQEQFHFGL